MISVIIPVYNKENLVKATLNSVLQQSMQAFEIIVVNDGSTDNSMKIVEEFNDERINIYSITNSGVSSARNYGVTKAKGKWIAFLDADDIWLPNHLENLKHLIENFPGCGLYCTAYETSYFNKKLVNGRYLGISHDFFGIIPNYFESSMVDSIAWSSSVAIPKSTFDKHGYFDVDLRSGQDTEFWIRIALKEKIAFSSKISARRIISNDGNHLSHSKKRIDRLKVLDRFKEAEEHNYSLKKYMDVIRYSVAIERKMSKDKQSFIAILQDIDLSNLNAKQKFLLKLPPIGLSLLKQFQVFLMKNKLYLTAFR